jgi:hypothetical protein
MIKKESEQWSLDQMASPLLKTKGKGTYQKKKKTKGKG